MSANLQVSFELSKQSRANVSYFAHILRKIVEKRFIERLDKKERSFFCFAPDFPYLCNV
jgi:hypothetical protein